MTNRTFIILLFFISSLGQIQAQEVLNNLSEDDSAAIATLSQFPQNVRKDMLQVCLHPELLPKLETLQKNSGEAFKKLVSGYPKEEQQKIWNLTTYLGLVDKLGAGKKSGEELDKIVAEYPEEIRATAKEYAGNRPELLNAMVSLNQNADKDFEALIKDYPDRTKEALRNLTKYPEVLNILTSNMKTTVILGDAFKNQPQALEQKLDAIAAEEARQNALDYEAWKSGLEKNPEAQKEMEESAQEFMNEQGNSGNTAVTEQTVIINNNYHGQYGNYYPYWYGYPWWYDYPVWYYRPYWYHAGFYRSHRGIIYIGIPTPFYAHWYFRQPHHHYRYNHFSDHCVGYYYGRRRPHYGFHREVHHWVRMNEPRVPRNYFNNDPRRADRIKELGKFEGDYDKGSKAAPGKLTRDDFLKRNANEYPNLKPVLDEPSHSGDRPRTPEKPREPVLDNRNEQRQTHPPVQVPRSEPSKPRPHKPRSAEPRIETRPEKPRSAEPKSQPQKPQPAPRQAEPKVQPRPQQAPQPAQPKAQPAPAPNKPRNPDQPR